MIDPNKLARILWQAAKMLVKLLEKEYGFRNREERSKAFL